MRTRGGFTGAVPRYAGGSVLLAALVFAGCTSPAERVDVQAAALGGSRSIAVGAGFRHVVYANGRTAPGSILHVYLEDRKSVV